MIFDEVRKSGVGVRGRPSLAFRKQEEHTHLIKIGIGDAQDGRDVYAFVSPFAGLARRFSRKGGAVGIVDGEKGTIVTIVVERRSQRRQCQHDAGAHHRRVRELCREEGGIESEAPGILKKREGGKSRPAEMRTAFIPAKRTTRMGDEQRTSSQRSWT